MTSNPEHTTDESASSASDVVDDKTAWWGPLEQRSAALFLLAGMLLLIGVIDDGLTMLGMGLEGVLRNLAFLGFIAGFIAAYLGLIGLYPRLTERAPRLARTAVLIILLPIIILLLLVVAILIEFEPPAPGVIFSTIFGGFALGITLFSVAALRTRTVSRAVGAALLLFAIPWFVLLVDGPILGFPISDEVTFVTSGLMAIAVFAIGYFLRAELESTDRAETAPTEVRHG